MPTKKKTSTIELQRLYDREMADESTRGEALRKRARRLVKVLNQAIGRGMPSVRTLGLGGNRVTIHRADMARMLAGAERIASPAAFEELPLAAE